MLETNVVQIAIQNMYWSKLVRIKNTGKREIYRIKMKINANVSTPISELCS